MDNNFDVIFFIHPKGCLKWTIIIVCIISDVIGAILAATDIGVGECIAKQVHYIIIIEFSLTYKFARANE